MDFSYHIFFFYSSLVTEYQNKVSPLIPTQASHKEIEIEWMRLFGLLLFADFASWTCCIISFISFFEIVSLCVLNSVSRVFAAIALPWPWFRYIYGLVIGGMYRHWLFT